MGYAIRDDGLGWRAIDSEQDLLSGEYYSETPFLPTNIQKLSEELYSLSITYQKDLEQYRLLWTSISITDGANEETRKANLRTQWNARTAQYSADVAAAKLKYQ